MSFLATHKITSDGHGKHTINFWESPCIPYDIIPYTAQYCSGVRMSKYLSARGIVTIDMSSCSAPAIN